MIRSVQLLLFVTLLVCAAKSEILNTKDVQTCINLCSSCGGVSIFTNDICDCRISEHDVTAAECLNHIIQQTSDLPADSKSSEDEIANRAARCSGQTGSVVGSTRRIASEDIDRVANYFMNGGPLTGTPLLGAQNTDCVSSSKDKTTTTGASSSSNVSAENPANDLSKFDAPTKNIPILGAQPKKPASLASRVPSLAANAQKTPSLGASAEKSSGVENSGSCGKSPITPRSSSPLGSNPAIGTPYGLSRGPQSPSLLGVVPQILLGIPHAVLDAVPGLLGLMHPQLLGAAQHPHLLGAPQHPHLFGSPHNPHLLGAAQYPHLLGAPQHPHLLGTPQNSQIPGTTQNSPLLGALATGAHGVLQNLDNVVSAYIPRNDHGQMVGAPQSQLTDVIMGVPNAILNTARIPGLLGTTQYSPFLGAVASEAHEVIQNLDNIVTGHAPGMDQSQLVGASQAQPGGCQSSKLNSSPASGASVGSENAPTDPLHQVLAHHNTLLEALSQHLGSYNPPVGAPYLPYSPIPYNSMLGTSSSNSCQGQGRSVLEASSSAAAEASSQAEKPPTKDPVKAAEPSAKEPVQAAISSAKEPLKAAESSAKETSKATESSAKETLKAAESSAKEISKDADPSMKETSNAADSSTKETSKDTDSHVGMAKLNSSYDSSTGEKKNEEEIAAKGDEEIAAKLNEKKAANGDEEIATEANEKIAAKGDEEIAAEENEKIAAKRDEEIAAEGNEKIAAKGDEEIAANGDEEIAAKENEEIAAKLNENISAKANEIEDMKSPQEESTEQPKLAAEASKFLPDGVNCKPKRDLNFSIRRKRQNIRSIKKQDTIVSPTKVR